MDIEQVALAVIDALEAERIPHMLVGSFSSNFRHGAGAEQHFRSKGSGTAELRIGGDVCRWHKRLISANSEFCGA